MDDSVATSAMAVGAAGESERSPIADKIVLRCLVYRFHESARIGGIPFRFDDIHISFWWIDEWRNGYGRASACDRSVVFGEGVV
jgi:hypothetical protein